ncbi:MAG: amidohydrolase [Bacteroidia bacterium]|nr:amidohydrolase [Bacteroidia bacterium]
MQKQVGTFSSHVPQGNLRVGWLQMALSWEQPSRNIERFEQMLERWGKEAEVWVLPEMWSTGFSMNTAIAEKEGGMALMAMQRWAESYQALFIGSLMVRVGHQVCNRLYGVYPNRGFFSYDKRHLFRMAGEQEHYVGGNRQVVLEWKGWRIAPQICYDLRFPVWSRLSKRYTYDLLVYVANWPAARHFHWQTLLSARAIENQAYVLGVNRVGKDGNGYHYRGGSTLVDFQGRHVLHAGEAEGAFVASIAYQALADYRDTFPAWRDADNFEFSPPVEVDLCFP